MHDANGNKIKAVRVDDENAVTPKLKIANDYWYISYDDGKSWMQLGKATGDDGSDGTDGAIIKVEESETEVVFTLADGPTITLPTVICSISMLRVVKYMSLPHRLMYIRLQMVGATTKAISLAMISKR